MIIPSDEQLEQQVRDFIQRIPRRKAGGGGDDESGSRGGGPFIDDGPRTTRLDTGEMAATTPPVTAASTPLLQPSGTTIHTPWEPTIDSSGYLSVRPGALNSLVPSNIFDTFSVGSSLNYIKLHAETDGARVTSLALVVDSSPIASSPVDVTISTPPTSFDLVVGMTNSGTAWQIEFSNLDYEPRNVFLTPKIPATPGEEPFDRWWRWVRQSEF
jgi:hypothetical protein